MGGSHVRACNRAGLSGWVINDCGMPAETLHIVHDLEGNRIAEYEVGGGLLREYVWLDGYPPEAGRA